MTDLRTAAQQALEYLGAPSAKLWPAGTQYRIIAALHAALAQQAEGGGNLPPPLQAEPDLSLCPQCNGPADNGHDRSIPPSPYLCTKCMAEMPQPSYNATVVDDAHPNGIPLEQWQNKPVAYREDIIRMAREAASEDGSIDRKDGKNVVLYAAKTSRFLERLAALAAAAEREAIIQAMPGGHSVDPQWVCDMIRARGNK